jgi:hypothetical protein
MFRSAMLFSRWGPLALLLAAAPALGVELLDQAQALVGDTVITYSELLIEARAQGVDLSPRPALRGELEDLLDRLVILRLRVLGARRAGLARVTVEEADQELLRRYPDWDRPGRRAELLAETGETEDEARERVGRQLLVERHIERRFRPNVAAELEEIERAYHELYIPRWRAEGKPIPSLLEALPQIEAELLAARVRGLVEEWTLELRREIAVEILPLPEAPAPPGRSEPE